VSKCDNVYMQLLRINLKSLLLLYRGLKLNFIAWVDCKDEMLRGLQFLSFRGPQFTRIALIYNKVNLIKIYNIVSFCDVRWPSVWDPWFSNYNEFHEFRSLLASKLFWVDFDHFRSKIHFFGAVAKIGFSLKSNHHCQI
jgi:hypothetical protein